MDENALFALHWGIIDENCPREILCAIAQFKRKNEPPQVGPDLIKCSHHSKKCIFGEKSLVIGDYTGEIVRLHALVFVSSVWSIPSIASNTLWPFIVLEHDTNDDQTISLISVEFVSKRSRWAAFRVPDKQMHKLGKTWDLNWQNTPPPLLWLVQFVRENQWLSYKSRWLLLTHSLESIKYAISHFEHHIHNSQSQFSD